MRTLAPAVEYQTPKASKTPSPPPQNRSGAPEAMDDFAAIRNRQVLDRATPDTTTAHTRDPFAPHLLLRARHALCHRAALALAGRGLL